MLCLATRFKLYHVRFELSTHDAKSTTNTKLAKSTALHDPAIRLEAGSCKPLVTKLASVLHTSVIDISLK